MNRQEIRRQALRALNDDPDTPVYWSASEVNDTIQEGMEVLAEESPSLKRTFTVARRPGRFIYELEGIGRNIMTPYRMWLPDLKRRLEAWSLTDLDREHRRWMTQVGDPWVWVSVDWRQFIIWPIPASPGGTIEIDCFVWPDDLIDDLDEPEFHASDHESLVFYGEMEGYLKQWDVARALDLLGQFSGRWQDAHAKAGIKQMQSQFGVRESAGGRRGGGIE